MNNGEIKIDEHPCFSFVFISLILCAEPIILNSFLRLIFLKLKSLLNEGIYNPFKLYLRAIFKLFEIKTFLLSNLHNFFIFFISFSTF